MMFFLGAKIHFLFEKASIFLVFYYLCIAFPKKVEDFFILGVIELLLQENPAKTWNIKNKIVYLWQKWKNNENDKRLYYHTSQIPKHQS